MWGLLQMADARPKCAPSAPSVRSLGFPSTKSVPFMEQAESIGPLCPRSRHSHGVKVRTGHVRWESTRDPTGRWVNGRPPAEALGSESGEFSHGAYSLACMWSFFKKIHFSSVFES